MVTANASNRLIQHYVDNFRRLPWRSSPGGAPPDPYRVWLSEIMLQQTTVAAVAPRFERFVARWPTIQALAAARDEDILQEWAGLGYYARARNLIACAREVARLGGFPTSAADLRKLPGVGGYTAAAIAAIAFGEPAPAVDTNVTRVLARRHGLKEPSRPQIERLVADMMPAAAPGDLIQALMDLGATICRPKAPDCRACPLRVDCAAHATGEPQRFPVAKPRKLRPLRHGIAWWIERDDRVWLARRPEKGPLGRMAALPGSAWTNTLQPEPPDVLGTVHHVFTHFALDLIVARRAEPDGDGWWEPRLTLWNTGLPTLYRKAVELAVDRDRRRAA